MGAASRCRIAVIDDDKSVLKALQRLLATHDFGVETYESADRFLEALRVPLPDCLVLDLQLPGTNGIELQRELLRLGLAFPVIVLTGYDDPDMRQKCRSTGAVACLSKPVDGRALLLAIRTAVPACRGAPGH